jgi:MFS family permease
MKRETSATDSALRRLTARLRSIADAFSKDYWVFFAAAFCMDLGFGLFFFLFSLYLADLHFDERFIGHTMACLTLGNVAGTVPAMIFARRKGIRPLLLMTFLCAPLLCVLRVLVLDPSAQLAIAFLTGMALCGWPICFSPAIAKFTHAENRTLGFSIAFATGIGLGSVAGLAGGYIPQLLQHYVTRMSLVGGIRIVLLSACCVVLLGLLPIVHLQIEHEAIPAGKHGMSFHPFLRRFLPGFLLWNVVTGSFGLLGAVYIQNKLGVSLGRIGTIFSASELLQFAAVLLAPLLLRRMGANRGVAFAQLGTMFFLVLIAVSRSQTAGTCFYLLYFAVQYMCEPGIYKILMEAVPEAERSTASAIQNLSGAVCQSGTTAITGICIIRFGYQSVLIANSIVALFAALAFLSLKTPPLGSDADAFEPCLKLHEAHAKP